MKLAVLMTSLRGKGEGVLCGLRLGGALGGFAVSMAIGLAGPALGQLSSEGPILQRSVPRPEEIEQEKETAAVHLGALRLSPFLGIRDLSYYSNVVGTSGSPVPDWTATLFGGTRFLLPVGGKSVFRGAAEPAYIYWNKLSSGRGWIGDYGGEWIGLFNRFTLEAGGGYRDWITVLSSESEQTVRNHLVTGRVGAEIDIFRRLAVVGRWESLKTAYSDIDTGGGATAASSLLDRTEQAIQGGLRYKPNDQFSLGLLADVTQVRFKSEGQDRNSDGRSLRLHGRYDQPSFYVEFTGGYATAEGHEALSYFPSYRTGVYRWFVSYFRSEVLELQAYGWRRPVYSYFLDNPYFFETRNGLQVNVKVTPRIVLSAFGNAGSNQYPVEVLVYDSIVTRKDDVVSWGGGLSWNVWRAARVSAIYAKDRYTSNVPGIERDVFRVSLNLIIGGKVLQ